MMSGLLLLYIEDNLILKETKCSSISGTKHKVHLKVHVKYLSTLSTANSVGSRIDQNMKVS